MQHEVKNLPRSQREITVTLSSDEFERHVERAARAASNEVAIPGFRKGKAPRELVENAVGSGALLERAAEDAARETYPRVLEEVAAATEQEPGKRFFPVGAPEITVTKLARGNEFSYRAVLSVLPEVVLPDNWRAIARRIRADRRETSVSDEDVEKALSWIRESRLVERDVDRPAAAGDAVEVDFDISRGGVKLDHASSVRHPLVIGKGKFMPGFEEKIVGMRRGEKREFTLAAPQDWHERSLAGRELEFAVTLQAVRERTVPELTDDFARSIGNFESVAALRESVRSGMAQEKQEKERDRVRTAIIDAIAEKTAADVPEVLVTAEIKKMTAELERGVASMGMQWSDYLAHIKKMPDDLEREWRGEAERRVRAALVIRDIAERENITPTEEEIAERAAATLRQYRTAKEAEKNIDPAQLREYTKNVLRNEKTFEFLETVQEQ